MLSVCPVYSAELSVTAEVDKNLVTLDDQIRLDVQVSGPGASLPEPRLPSMPNFSVSSVGNSQNISMVNGTIESSLVFSYILLPRFVGKAVIAPITVEADGKTAQSSPIEIQVSRPSNATASPPPATGQPRQRQRGQAQGAPGPDIMLEASLDKPKAYVNEQVTLSIKFFQGAPLIGNPNYAPPNLTGFFAEELPQLRYERNVNGKRYGVTELKAALFPNAGGKLTVGPAHVQGQIAEPMAMDPYASDFLQRFIQFGGGSTARPVEAHSNPVAFEALALPEDGKPKDFNGAVGLYNMSAMLSRSEVKVGEAVDLILIIEGEGNLKTVFAPKIPDAPTFRVYDTLASLSMKKDLGMVRGSKTFKTILVPRASGRLSIPKITFSFFDPKTHSYRTRSVGPLGVTVEASTEAAASLPSGAGGPRGAVAVESDVQFIKDHTLRRPWTTALGAFGSAGVLHALPGIFMMVCAALFGIRERRRRLDPRIIRFAEALQSAQERLTVIRAHKGENGAIPALGEILTRYLADKLGTSPNGLTLRQSIALLKKSAPHLAEGRMKELQDIWEELDSMRYAPSKTANGVSAAEELAHRMEALFDLLEREIRL